MTILESIPSLVVPPANPSLPKKTTMRIGIVGGSIGGLAAAACLQKAGFDNITVLERATEHRAGAGIGLDDASVGILKGLGLEMMAASSSKKENSSEKRNSITVQSMRLTEERVLNPDAPHEHKPLTLLRLSCTLNWPEDWRRP